METRCFSICAWTESMFKSELDDNNGRNIMLTAYFNDMIAGYIIVRLCLDEAEIMVLAVDEPFRRNGIAEMLIDHVEMLIKGRISRIMLEVREKNEPAINLYTKKGFKRTGLRKNYYRDFSGQPPENAVLMTKEMLEKC
jgi:ribosomal-protein-alanine N-acetyltransferase